MLLTPAPTKGSVPDAEPRRLGPDAGRLRALVSQAQVAAGAETFTVTGPMTGAPLVQAAAVDGRRRGARLRTGLGRPAALGGRSREEACGGAPALPRPRPHPPRRAARPHPARERQGARARPRRGGSTPRSSRCYYARRKAAEAPSGAWEARRGLAVPGAGTQTGSTATRKGSWSSSRPGTIRSRWGSPTRSRRSSPATRSSRSPTRRSAHQRSLGARPADRVRPAARALPGRLRRGPGARSRAPGRGGLRPVHRLDGHRPDDRQPGRRTPHRLLARARRQEPDARSLRRRSRGRGRRRGAELVCLRRPALRLDGAPLRPRVALRPLPLRLRRPDAGPPARPRARLGLRSRLAGFSPSSSPRSRRTSPTRAPRGRESRPAAARAPTSGRTSTSRRS